MNTDTDLILDPVETLVARAEKDSNNEKTKKLSRHNVQKHLTAAYDTASSALKASQGSIQAWLRTLVAIQLPINAGGTFLCTAVGQSGRTYWADQGGALMVDQRDLAPATVVGSTAVPSGVAPTTGLRAGLVFFDTSLSQYMRYDGANWSPVTLS